jgi:hypothetical protein
LCCSVQENRFICLFQFTLQVAAASAAAAASAPAAALHAAAEHMKQEVSVVRALAQPGVDAERAMDACEAALLRGLNSMSRCPLHHFEGLLLSSPGSQLQLGHATAIWHQNHKRKLSWLNLKHRLSALTKTVQLAFNLSGNGYATAAACSCYFGTLLVVCLDVGHNFTHCVFQPTPTGSFARPYPAVLHVVNSASLYWCSFVGHITLGRMNTLQYVVFRCSKLLYT